MTFGKIIAQLGTTEGVEDLASDTGKGPTPTGLATRRRRAQAEPEGSVSVIRHGLLSGKEDGMKNIIIRRPFAEAVRTELMVARLLAGHGLKPMGGAAADAWLFTNVGRTKLLDGTFDIDSDSYKMALFLSTSDIGPGSTTYAALTNEHASGNGYTTGGESVVLALTGTTTVKVDINTDPVWTASGGDITARFAVIYEVGGDVLCYCLLDNTPADVTATSGNTLTVAAHTSGVFTLA